MKELIFRKVDENTYQRFYALSTPVVKAPNQGFVWENEKKYIESRLKEKYKPFLTEKIEYVCVSDAHTHIERLLFAAMPLDANKTEFSRMSGTQMDGKHTFMIHGGDSRDVHPDYVYLRRLASANGMTFKMDVTVENQAP